MVTNCPLYIRVDYEDFGRPKLFWTWPKLGLEPKGRPNSISNVAQTKIVLADWGHELNVPSISHVFVAT